MATTIPSSGSSTSRSHWMRSTNAPPMHSPGPATVLMTADTIGGVWTYSMELARGLTARGTQVNLATMGELMAPEQREEANAIQGLHVIESTYKLEWMDSPW